jgi:hypothetical protein
VPGRASHRKWTGLIAAASLAVGVCAGVGVVVGLPTSAGGMVSLAGTFASVSPARLLDTRTGNGVAAAGPIAGGHMVALPVAGRGGVPAFGV